ncbi:MAG: YdiU family protein [Clostridiales bacterium]|nr:YdiU family protein [Clostridiales bacterium]
MKYKTDIGFNLQNSYTKLPSMFYSLQSPDKVPLPKIVAFNNLLCTSLGLNGEKLLSEEGGHILSGNEILEGTTPLAEAYAGHQFGYFTMLGDGRAILLGEQKTPKGELYDIQLKGSGKTKYSRGGDGKAVLGPMLREYIVSEGMNALGIPTTRSLAVVTTGEVIFREKEEKGAILTRIAKSHIRVGTFQYAAEWGSLKDLKDLADYTINRHFKEGFNTNNPYLFLLKQVIKNQAALISKWQMVGFIHGVMNTDNMSIAGETIDYGPCAFMDTYNPNTVFSSIDTYGRYAYGNQPKIAAWNLARFAEALLPLLHSDENKAIKIAQKAIFDFNKEYTDNWIDGMRKKLGLFNKEEDDNKLANELLLLMEKYSEDYTNTFSALTYSQNNKLELFETEEFSIWNNKWQNRLNRQEESIESSKELMALNNPVIIPRNHRVEEALSAAVNEEDYSVMNKLLDAIRDPFNYSKNLDYYNSLPEPSKIPYKTYCGT